MVLTGLVPPERVPACMRAMDILIHASYREGLPRTVPQALLCGVVPIAYDADGTREVCIEGKTGKLVPVGSRARLRGAVLDLIDAPDERAERASHARHQRGRLGGLDLVGRLAHSASRRHVNHPLPSGR